MAKQTHYTFERQQFFRAYLEKGQVKISRKWGFVDGCQLFLHRGHRRTCGRIVEPWTIVRLMISGGGWEQSEAKAIAALVQSIERSIKSCRMIGRSVKEQQQELKAAKQRLRNTKPLEKGSPANAVQRPDPGRTSSQRSRTKRPAVARRVRPRSTRPRASKYPVNVGGIIRG